MKSLHSTRFYGLLLFFALTVWGCKEEDPTPTPAQAPTDLAYAPNTLTLTQGNAGTSAKPSIKGTAPITYSLAVTPTQAGFSINGEGVIQVANTVPVGVYTLNITATNTAGSKTFNNAYTVTVGALIPSNLVYGTNSLTLVQGNAGSSVIPTVQGTAPLTYQATVSPANAGITINAQGVIQVANTVTQGVYNVSVGVTNAAGTTNFPNVYTVTINLTTVAPTALTYNPATLNILQGLTTSSNNPSVQGTQPITFEITSVTPANSAITINAQGKLTVGTTSAAGTFKVSVRASNSAGTPIFTDAFTFVVRAPVTFNANIQPLLQSKCAPCHTGGGQSNWNVYNTSKNSIDAIINRVQRTQGSTGFMPQNGQPLTATEIALLQQWKNEGLKEQ